MQSFKQLAAAAAKVVNATLGAACTYYLYDDLANPLPGLSIIVDKNNAVKDSMGNVLGFEVVASVEKSVMPRRPMQRDYFVDDEGVTWYVNRLREESTAKWYFSVTER